MTEYLNPETGETGQYSDFIQQLDSEDYTYPDLIEVIVDCTGEYIIV